MNQETKCLIVVIVAFAVVIISNLFICPRIDCIETSDGYNITTTEIGNLEDGVVNRNKFIGSNNIQDVIDGKYGWGKT